MQKISVVIITFNEEKNIGRCLDAIIGIAEDVVVVDSFSTDRTKEIVLEKGARFVTHKFEGHIQQKNWAISQAKFPIILSLDADEVVSELLKSEILKAKENWDADGYYFNRLNNYCGKWIKHCNWYPDRKLRLWDSRKGKWGGTNPHDKFEMESGCSVKYIKADLMHYTFHTIEQHIETINKFSTIAAQMRFKKGKKTNLLRILFKPFTKFIFQYILRLGFLDGYYGYIVCKNSATSAFLKEIKLKQLYKEPLV
jgi:glycosyltransferase involved in cell wall biosynthesis